MNDNIDYERDFLELKFMRLTDAASAAAILKHAHTAVSSSLSVADAKALKPTAMVEDLTGYFNQFSVAPCFRDCSGMEAGPRQSS